MRSAEDESENPLVVEPKREKSGSDTYRKYNYQYHWALCRLLEEHENGEEYAIFVEEHEDVVIAHGLNVETVLFEFNQVKETSKRHTIDSLTKIEKNGSSSLIGKLSFSASGKSYSDKIVKINFVSTGGYKFNLHGEGFDLEVISSGFLKEEEVEKIKACIGSESDAVELLKKLAFVIPSLPKEGFDYAVEGKISSLISKMSPGFKYDSNSIYECVIRDLRRKGENKFDYKFWDEALKRKAVTSKQFSEVLDKHIDRKPDANVVSELIEVLKNEYGLMSVQRRGIVQGFHRYYIQRVSGADALVNVVSEELVSAIEQHFPNHSGARELEKPVRGELSSTVQEYFSTSDELTGAFLYELLSGEPM